MNVGSKSVPSLPRRSVANPPSAILIGETCGADAELRGGSRPPFGQRRRRQPRRFPDGPKPGEPRVPGRRSTDLAATSSRDGNRLPPLPLSDRAGRRGERPGDRLPVVRIELSPGDASRPRRGARVTASALVGRFTLIDTVGVGAFGTVYKARDPELDRVVAIKVPRAGNLSTADDRARFVAKSATRRNCGTRPSCPSTRWASTRGRRSSLAGGNSSPASPCPTG